MCQTRSANIFSLSDLGAKGVALCAGGPFAGCTVLSMVSVEHGSGPHSGSNILVDMTLAARCYCMSFLAGSLLVGCGCSALRLRA